MTGWDPGKYGSTVSCQEYLIFVVKYVRVGGAKDIYSL